MDTALGPPLRLGRQWLFVIGISKYSDWRNLSRPAEDAREIKELLQARYRIDEVAELYDAEATKGNILRKFRELQGALLPEDSLLVFYAGHGHYDRMVTNTGFWIPTNGGTDVYEQANWIPNAQIRGIIGNFKARHICLISDSCFSGDILDTTRGLGLPEGADELTGAKAYALASRQVITSGAQEAVPDTSEFTRQLKMALMSNTEPYLDPLTLYAQIKKGVRNTLPLLGELKGTGHQEGASFYLFLKSPTGGQTVSPPLNIPQTPPRVPADDSGPRVRFFLSAQVGALVPAFGTEALMGLGFGSSLSIGCYLPIPSGYLGFSLLSGVASAEMQEGLSSSYTLYSIPLGGSLLYEIALLRVFHVILEAGGGEMVSILSYRNGYTPIVYTPFFSGSLGANLVIGRDWSVGVFGRCSGQFFSNVLVTSITPGVSVRYCLR